MPFSKQTTKICAQAREPDGMKTMDAKADTKAGQEMTGAEMVLEALKDNGVRHIFGYPGGAVLPIYDELFQQDAIEHILVRHEQGHPDRGEHPDDGDRRVGRRYGLRAVEERPKRGGAVRERRGMTLEQVEEPVLSRHQGTKPSQHVVSTSRISV